MKYFLTHPLRLLSLSVLFLLASCDRTPIEVDLIESTGFQINPSGFAPLTAQVLLRTSSPVRVRTRVIGKHGPDSDVIRSYSNPQTNWDLMILGLYPDYLNTVEMELLDAGGNLLEMRSFEMQTDLLSEDLPNISIDVPAAPGTTPGYNLVSYFGHSSTFTPQRPFMFDEFGDIRWYLDFRDDAELGGLFYDNGPNRLRNGNLVFGNGSTSSIYEINMYGKIEQIWRLNGYGFHHHIIEKENGNFLITATDFSRQTIEDVIIELGRNSRQVIREWDLLESMDYFRRTWDTDLAVQDIDWFHANGLAWDESDNTLIVSGRTQGTIKLNLSNRLIWILAPHKGWGTSGNGTDLAQFLLQPLDAQGNPITDSLVLKGETNHPDFEWPWYQHSPIILPNGNIMLFDNGDNRNYSGAQWDGSYSRAVEYKIDESKMTIQQVWSYGKERGEEIYSRIVSKVNYHEEEENVFMSSGAIFINNQNYGKAIEIDHNSQAVLFEATIRPPIAPFNITFHNVQRLTLYPEN